MSTILIIGVRRNCYKAAIKLGHNVVLWGDGPLNNNRKKKLTGWIEVPFDTCVDDLSPEAKTELGKHQFDFVIANTEETVVLGGRVRKYLGLKTLAVNVIERFHNKFVMKNCAREIGIPITKYMLIEEKTEPNDLIKNLGFPMVIKPLDSSGAQDVRVIKNENELKKYFKPNLLAEAFVDGPECSVETFIKDGEPMFHNITDYLHQWRKSAIPADIHDPLKQQILELNDKIIKHFGVDRGITHSEFYLTKNGPVFGEIAIRPPGGYYMELIKKVYGLDTWKTYVQLCCMQDVPKLSRPLPNKGYAGVFMLHPGKGKLVEVQGLELVKQNIKGIFDFNLRKKIGDNISDHENTSNEIGHILFWAPTYAELLKDFAYIESTVVFKME